MNATTIVVDQESEGARLDVWLAQASGRVRSEVVRLIVAGQVRVDGSAAAKSMRLTPGQLVLIEQTDDVRVPTGPPPDVQIRFEDEHMAIVNKPAGLVVHPAPGTRAATLIDALAPRMPLAPASGAARPGIVHRLDKGTSGLLMVAKTDAAYFALVDAIKNRKVLKTYLALVHGVLTISSGRIEAPVGRSSKRPTAMAVTAEGKSAVTEFEVLETMGGVSYLKVDLITGRTHQIRVHFAHIKHQVVGDQRYGGGAEHLAGRLGLTRPFLHAAALQLDHPITGESLQIEEPLPQDLVDALERARQP